jgi:hypothetical protein
MFASWKTRIRKYKTPRIHKEEGRIIHLIGAISDGKGQCGLE